MTVSDPTRPASGNESTTSTRLSGPLYRESPTAPSSAPSAAGVSSSPASAPSSSFGASGARPHHSRTSSADPDATVLAPSGEGASAEADQPTALTPAVGADSPKKSDDKPERNRPATVANRAGGRVRKARLRLSRVDPWSMMKTAFLFSIAGGIIFWVATYVTWGVIQGSGLFEAINKVVSDVVNAPGDPNKFQIETYVSTNKVLGVAAALAAVDVVIFTALGTLGAFLYNLSATMLGGLEVTLAED